MAQKCEFAWSGATWNPVTGCTKIGTGSHAEHYANRRRGVVGHPHPHLFHALHTGDSNGSL